MDINVLPVDLTNLSGSIGLMSAPGQEQSLAADLDELAKRYGCTLLVSLVSNHELDILGMNDLPERCAERGMRLIRYPIADFSAPSSIESASSLISQILFAANHCGMVAIHCRAGLGRTGLVAACCLVACGMSSSDAVGAVRRCRPRAIENSEQEQFIDRVAKHLADAESRADPGISP